MKSALKLAAVLAIGLVAFDAVIDGGGCPSTGTEASSCHACACGPRLAAGCAAVVEPREAPRALAPYAPLFHAVLLPTFVFHPPRAAA